MNNQLPVNPPPPAWGRAPLLPVALAVMAGVLLADWTDYGARNLWWWSTLVTQLAAGALLGLSSARRSVAVGHSALLLLSVLGLAAWRSTDAHLPNHPAFFANTETECVQVPYIISLVFVICQWI